MVKRRRRNGKLVGREHPVKEFVDKVKRKVERGAKIGPIEFQYFSDIYGRSFPKLVKKARELMEK